MNAQTLYDDDEFAPRPAFPVSSHSADEGGYDYYAYYTRQHQRRDAEGEEGTDTDDAAPPPPPMTAEEYLMQVRQEANAIPDIMVSQDVDERTFDQRRQTGYLPAMGSIVECDREFLPTEEWRDNMLAEFSDLRVYMSQASIDEEHTRKRQAVASINLPPLSNWNSWYYFFTGSVLSTESETEVNSEENNIEGIHPHPPMVGLLARKFDQAKTSKLIMKASQHVEENPEKWTVSFLLWIFGLLAKIEKPLHSSVSSSLRTLLRWISKVRKDLASSDPTCAEYAATNVVYYVIADYFRQNVSATL
eukprot:gb/GECG01006447.1/.p1 GENE.gb/GECG01006447.1/~~gb/GECG01006447.1/.p1  ORF type:complete len:304 (+),score=41.66 gb/GECG01006447.1/:1-912(+)